MCNVFHTDCNTEVGNERWMPGYAMGDQVNYFSARETSEFYHLEHADVVLRRYCSKEERWYYGVVSSYFGAGFLLPEDELNPVCTFVLPRVTQPIVWAA